MKKYLCGTLLLGSLLAFTACKGEDQSAPAPTAAAPSAAETASAAAATPSAVAEAEAPAESDDDGDDGDENDKGKRKAKGKGSVKRHKQLTKLVKIASKKCEYKVDTFSFPKCPANELGEATELVTGKLNDKKAVIITLTDIMANEKPQLATAAAFVMSSVGFRHVEENLRQNAKFVSRETAEAALEAMRKTKGVSQAVRPIVHMATANGLIDETVKALDKIPGQTFFADSQRRTGYRQLLRFGRLDALDKVEKIAGGDDVQNAAAAILSTTEMGELEGKEQKRICKFLKGFLDAKTDDVAAAAAGAMGMVCDPKFRAKLFKEAEERLKKAELTQAFVRPFGSVCSRLKFESRKDVKAQVQLKRCVSFLTETVQAEKVDASARLEAARSLSWVNTQEVEDFCTKQAGSKNLGQALQDALGECQRRVSSMKSSR